MNYFLFISFLIILNVVNTQTIDVVKVESKSSIFVNPDFFCFGVASIVLGYSQPLVESDFGLPDPTSVDNIRSLTTKKIDTSNIANQLFIFSYTVVPYVYNASITIKNATLGLDYSLIIPIEPCNYLNSSSFSYKSYKGSEGVLPYRGNIQLLVDFQTPTNNPYTYYPLYCVAEEGFSCNLSPYSYLLPNVYIADISIEPNFPTLKPTLNISLGSGGFSQPLQIKNPFYNYLDQRTTIVKDFITYPPNDTIAFIPVTRNDDLPATVLKMTVEDMNSIAYTYFNSASHAFYPVKSNSQYMELENIFLPLGSIDVYIINNITYYYNKYAPIVSWVSYTNIIPPTYSIYQDIETQTNAAQISISANSTLNFYINLESVDAIFYFDWYPSSMNGTYYDYRLTIPIPNAYSGSFSYLTGVGYNRYSGGFDSHSVGLANVPLIITSLIEVIQITDYSFLARLSLQSKFEILYIDFAGVRIKSSDLVNGDGFNGLYEKEIPYFQKKTQYYTIKITDTTGYTVTFYEGLNYNYNLNQVPTISFNSNNFTTIKNITSLWFLKKQVDISKGSADNALIMKLNKINPNFNPYFKFDNDTIKYPAFYERDQDIYVFNITVPRYLFGNQLSSYKIIDFNFDNDTIAITGDSLFVLFGQNATLDILNENGDIQQPTIKGIYRKPTQGSALEWIITIEDSPNGFLEGTVDIYSEFDTPYTIYFNNTNRVSGNAYLGNYSIVYTMNMNCGKPFRLANFKLFDKSKLKQTYDPLLAIYGTPFYNEMEITPSCIVNSTSVSTLRSINFPTTIEVGDHNRMINFSFSVSNPVGISTRHMPTIVLTSENVDIFKIRPNLTSISSGSVKYTASAQLPYGFGFQNIFVNIYGIVGNDLSFRSFSHIDLKNQSLNYYITRSFTNTIPVLIKASPLRRTGGSLTLFGKGFGIDSSNAQVLVNYQDSNGYKQLNVGFFTCSVLQTSDNIQPFLSKFITVKVIINGTQSNELIISPILPFVNNTIPDTPGKCPGIPTECSGQGTCVSGVCQCQSPWYGPTCSSKIIIIPTPDPQPEPTTGINVTDNTNTINSIIQISEIRELDQSLNTINTFQVDKWNFTDISNISLVPTYLYKTKLLTRTTTIEVRIEFFKNETQIPFGKQILNVGPSTIKYSIDISPFDFTSRLSSLQVVMDAVIKGSNQGSCSSKQVGQSDNNSVEWIKINIDKTSLYGRFLSFGLIDDREMNITNMIVDGSDSNKNDSSQLSSIKIGLTVPYYETSVILDPDFSNILDLNDSGTTQLCAQNKKKLSNGAIAAIVVGSVVFASVVIVASVVVIKKRKFSAQEKIMESKLKSVG